MLRFNTSKRFKRSTQTALLLLVSLLLAACGDSPNTVSTLSPLPSLAPTFSPVPATPLPNYSSNAFGATDVNAELIGSGSTFADPVYNKWFGEFKKTAPNIKISYQAIGSGNGRAAFLGTPVPTVAPNLKPTVPNDFAGSDVVFTGQQLVDANSKGTIVHIPTVIGGVTLAYRLDNFKNELKLSGQTIAKIFMGDIKDWSHPDITADNGGQALPAKPITVVIRSRTTSSGTSEIFSRYLSVVSSDFREKVGPGGSPKWPTIGQLEGGSNDEVAAAISGRDGSIGYVDLNAALEKKLNYASVRNQTGRYIRPTQESLTAAVQGVSIPDDFRIFVVNAEGENSYPIAGFTWIIVWKDFNKLQNPSMQKAQALANFLWWGITEGQRNLPDGFAPLPASLIPRLQQLFVNNNDPAKVFQFNGKPIFS